MMYAVLRFDIRAGRRCMSDARVIGEIERKRIFWRGKEEFEGQQDAEVCLEISCAAKNSVEMLRTRNQVSLEGTDADSHWDGEAELIAG